MRKWICADYRGGSQTLLCCLVALKNDRPLSCRPGSVWRTSTTTFTWNPPGVPKERLTQPHRDAPSGMTEWVNFKGRSIHFKSKVTVFKTSTASSYVFFMFPITLQPLMDCAVCYKTAADQIETSPKPYVHCIQKPRLTQVLFFMASLVFITKDWSFPAFSLSGYICDYTVFF